MNRQRLVEDLADLVTELVDEVRTAEPYARDPVGPWRGKTYDQRSARHFTREAGLLAQLDLAAVPGSGAREDDAGPAKPTSRPPVTGAFELSCDVVVGASRLRRELRTATGRTLGRRQHVGDDLREVVGLSAEVDDETARAALRQVRQWVTSARVLLRYDVVIVELVDVSCPYCEGSLRVRRDASSEVWCATPECRDDEGRRHVWPRSMWLLLLDQAGEGIPEVKEAS